MKTINNLKYSTILKSTILFWVGLMAFRPITYGQNNIETPRFTPSNPEAKVFEKYGQIPVSQFTGIPKILIPLHNIQVKDFTVPINISYHAGGIKVNEIASWVGLGWALNAGGIITRQINGIPDESQNGILSAGIPTSNQLNSDSYSLLYHALHLEETGTTDIERDEFYFNFLNNSGKFYLNPNGSIVQIPFSELKIEFINNTYFKITDSLGNIFIFQDTEQSSYYSTYYDTNYSVPTYKFSGITAWHLTEIIPVNNNGSIIFQYDKSSTGVIRNYNYTAMIAYDNTDIKPNQITNEKSVIYSSGEQSYLKQITFLNGKVVFEGITGRSDDPNGGGKILDKIKIYDSQTTSPIKTITFNHDYWYSDKGVNVDALPNDKYRLRLNKVIQQGSDGMDIETYRFEYNSLLLPPRKNCGIDLWGYYNGHESNQTLVYYDQGIVSGDHTTFSFSGKTYTILSGNRTPDENSSQACMLKKIYYPTGGFTEFEFEANRFNWNTTFKGAGLRVKKISAINSSGDTASVKIFKYGENENGLGVLSFFPYLLNRNSYIQKYTYVYPQTELNPCSYTKFNRFHIQDRPLYNHSYIDGESVVGYSQITEYDKSLIGLSGKEVYYFDTSMDDFNDDLANEFPFGNRSVNLSWKRGILLKDVLYKKQGDIFSPIQKTINTYDTFRTSELAGLYVGQRVHYLSGNTSCDTPEIDEDFYYFDFLVNTGVKKLIKSVDSVFVNNNTLTKETSYYYGSINSSQNAHGLVTKKTILNSNGENIETKFRYPSNINTGSYTSMTTLNMLNYPIEETTFVDNNVTASKLTTYKVNGNSYVPDKVYSLETTTPVTANSFTTFDGNTKDTRYGLTPEYSFDTYDSSNGNPLKMLAKNGLYTCYIWAYNKTYPVAKIESSINTTIDITVDDTLLKKTTAFADIQSDATYLKGLFNSYLTNKDYMVTLYTYKPLTGMTSQTDPAGRTTYFEYDEFGRLKLVKDLAGNIQKKYEYHYAGQ